MLRVIYDCGSGIGRNPRPPLGRAIRRMLSELEAEARIDLLVISHFDRDHVNGINLLAAELAGRRIKVGRVWTPLMTKIEALLAISTKAPSDETPEDYATFLDDPVGRLADLFPGAEITQIGPTEGPIPPAPDVVDPDDAPQGGDSAGKIKVKKHPGGNGLIISTVSAGLGEVLWEIQPYVIESTMLAAGDISAEVSRLIGKPVEDCTLADLIKLANDKQFLQSFHASVKDHQRALGGSSSSARTGANLSSVCIYSGPTSPYDWCRYRKGWVPVAASQEAIPIAPAWLGTGDAGLKRPSNVDAMRAAFTTNRLDRIGLASAPHHAAKDDSGADLWDALPNLRRVTIEADHASSGPRHHHPHQAVLDELAPRNLYVHFCVFDEVGDFHWRDKGIR